MVTGAITNAIVEKFYELKADVARRENDLMVVAEVPGMELKDLEIKTIGKYIIIEGAKRMNFRSQQEKGGVNNECLTGQFKKYIPVPKGFSNFQDIFIDRGILNIRIAAE